MHNCCDHPSTCCARVCTGWPPGPCRWPPGCRWNKHARAQGAQQHLRAAPALGHAVPPAITHQSPPGGQAEATLPSGIRRVSGAMLGLNPATNLGALSGYAVTPLTLLEKEL